MHAEALLGELPQSAWLPLASAHESRIDALVEPHLARRREHTAHPVEDFLFTYYTHSPAALRRWHPGFGRTLTGELARRYIGLKGYDERRVAAPVGGPRSAIAAGGCGVGVTAAYVTSRRRLLTDVRTLLAATASRPAAFGCFGMHEWAMVYRSEPSHVRHPSWPLRLGAAGTDEVVERSRITCSHFDAFRFFTPSARPLNTLRPGADDRPRFEQPGCLHAGMDLYKHAYRLSPMIASELVADCFELARDIRVLDMRASPYDLSGLGYDPVRVETPEGRAAYVAAQRAFAERAAPLRSRLIDASERLLAVS